MKTIAVAVFLVTGGLVLSAETDDIEIIRNLLKVKDPAQAAANQRTIDLKLTVLLTVPSVPYRRRLEAVRLVAEHDLKYIIPLLVEQIDNTGELLGSIRPWEQTYTSVAGLLSFADASVTPVFKALIAEQNAFRRDLMLITLLGILGREDTAALFAAYAKEAGTTAVLAQMQVFIKRAEWLAPGVPGIRAHDRPQKLPFPIAILQDGYQRPPYGQLIKQTVTDALAKPVSKDN